MWKFLHIACMFGAATTAVGFALFRTAILRSGEVVVIRRTLAAERRLGNLVGFPLFLAGIAFGFVTAVTTGFDLTAPWLLTAYMLVAALFINGFGFYDPQLKKLERAVEASDDAAPSPELTALIGARKTQLFTAVEVFLWFAIIFVMVVKPFS